MTNQAMAQSPQSGAFEAVQPCEEAVRAVQDIAEVLERVRRVCNEIGLATLVAQVHELPQAAVCAALEEVAAAGERALETLLA
jgi:hypothetical protein